LVTTTSSFTDEGVLNKMTESTGSLSPEDAKLIAAAVGDGRISDTNVLTWMNAMRADRDGTRRTLHSLPSIKADLSSEQVHAKVLGRLGLAPEPTKPRPVAAATPEAIAQERAILDSVGLPVAQTPKPVMIKPGTDPSQWTPEQVQNARLRSLGPRFAEGVPKPPAGPTWYIPSPNDHVRFDEATGQWVEKNPYRELP
jgi:hypothetical protein